MAIKRYVIDGYGQIELNNCAFRRDGRIEAQCVPSTTSTEVASNWKVENGMLMAVDKAKGIVTFAADSHTADNLPLALVYSAEHIYDERTPGLKNFALNHENDFLPRLGYLSVGDAFTENCICYNTAEFATESALISAIESCAVSALYGVKSTNGAIHISKASLDDVEGPLLKVVKKTTMPDGSLGVKFQVISC